MINVQAILNNIDEINIFLLPIMYKIVKHITI